MRLIDADALKAEIATIMPSRIEVFLVVDKMPDAIVMCKDCRYKWSDNHGELIRCKDCKWHEMRGEMLLCKAQDKPHTYDWYCADGEART